MNHYRSSSLLNIQRVKVSIQQPAVVKQKYNVVPPPPRHARPSAPVQPITRTPPPPVRPVSNNRPVTITPHTQRANRPQPVLINRNQQKVVSKNRSVSLGENRRSMAHKTEAVEQHRQAIMRIKDIGVGKILVILANGPSINEVNVEELNNIGNIDLMCINKPNKKVWPTKYWAFCDQSQYTRNQAEWELYTGMLITASAVRARHRNQTIIKNLSGTGFSKDMVKGYYIGRSSTYAAMQLALWLNYDKVYIFGCDMTAVDGKLHFYGQNPDVNNEHRVERFKQEGESFMYAAQNLSSEERQRFVFCSNYNKFKFLDYFQRMDHLQAVQLILADARSK